MYEQTSAGWIWSCVIEAKKRINTGWFHAQNSGTAEEKSSK